MSKSKIEWTEHTWNPTTGCTKISEGCANCYAELMSRRLKGMGIPKYSNGFKLTVHENCLLEPYKWKFPKVIFVNSMSDLFHEDMPYEFIEKVFKVMNENPQHTFQVLTKRSDVLLKYNKDLNWTKNIWMGVTIENNKVKDRIDHLRETDAHIKFLSCEPLLSDLGKINLKNIDWVIVGGETGLKSRYMKDSWVFNIIKQCRKCDVPFFFKQWGGRSKKENHRLIYGETYDEMPKEYKVSSTICDTTEDIVS